MRRPGPARYTPATTPTGSWRARCYPKPGPNKSSHNRTAARNHASSASTSSSKHRYIWHPPRALPGPCCVAAFALPPRFYGAQNVYGARNVVEPSVTAQQGASSCSSQCQARQSPCVLSSISSLPKKELPVDGCLSWNITHIRGNFYFGFSAQTSRQT